MGRMSTMLWSNVYWFNMFLSYRIPGVACFSKQDTVAVELKGQPKEQSGFSLNNSLSAVGTEDSFDEFTTPKKNDEIAELVDETRFR